MKFRLISEVDIGGMKIKDDYVHEFSDDSIVFDRMYEYHQRMHKVFPGCKFRLIKGIELEGRKDEKI